MIIVRLKGGLGNQMFQYALARLLSLKNSTSLLIDLEEYNRDITSKGTQRVYELDVFNINHRLTNSFFKKNWINKVFLKFRRIKYVSEKKISFDNSIHLLKGNLYLDGFWQTELYFKEIRNLLIKEFSPRKVFSKDNIAWADKINGSEAISIHVRRGDYLNIDGEVSYHGVCSKDYYLRAISYIENILTDPVFFIFSDDFEWVKNNLILTSKHFYITNNTNKSSYMDMRLMSLCKHNIIANSSFSWWGAWLNQNAKKIVIAPKQWFTMNSPSDILPENWISI